MTNSRGPTDAGSAKPDLAAPGRWRPTARSGSREIIDASHWICRLDSCGPPRCWWTASMGATVLCRPGAR
jgi:hypothetical protein